MHIKTEPFGPAEAVEMTSDIQSVHFDGKKLTVAIAKRRLPSGKVAGAIVTFPAVQGFRFLDECDLARYWSADGFVGGSYILRIVEGGWSEEESHHQGYSTLREEWIVITGNGCLNVFALEEPSNKEVELDFDP